MFFSPIAYVEADRRICSTEETDILGELLLDGDFFCGGPHAAAKTTGNGPGPSSTSASIAKRTIEFSLPQVSVENSSLRSVTTTRFPSTASAAFVCSSILSPPRLFAQDIAAPRYPTPTFFYDQPNCLTSTSAAAVAANSGMYGSSGILETPVEEARTIKSVSTSFPRGVSSMSSTPSIGLTAAAVPGDIEVVAPKKRRKVDKKPQLCSFPECPNLRRTGGYCNRHSGKRCDVHGCERNALSRGKCPEHGGGSRCKRDGCFKFAQTRGLCKSHGGGRQCGVSGCTKNAHQNRLCRSHGGGKRCSFFGCQKWAQRSGFCCTHTKTDLQSSSSPLLNASSTAQ